MGRLPQLDDGVAADEVRGTWVARNRLLLGVAVAVVAIWLVGAAVTRYTLEEMALFAPIAVVVVGMTVGIVMLWVKIAIQVRDDRRQRAGAKAGRPGDA